MHVARDLKGKEKWALFRFVNSEVEECLSSQFPEIGNIKPINKVGNVIIYSLEYI